MESNSLVAAGLDIGTNTILMVVAEKSASGDVRVLTDEHSVARLGADVDKSGKISDAALARAVPILERYASICKQCAVQSIVAVTTSAMRDASNSAEIRAALEQALGHSISVIDGEHEASLSFRGASPGGLSTIIDIGGGSTEIVSGDDGPQHARSLDIGAVRLSERHFPALPPSAEQADEARRTVRQHLEKITWADFGTLVGVGGTPSSLAAMAFGMDQMRPAELDGRSISAADVARLCRELLNTDVESIRAHPAIHPHRADILPMGSIILDEIMQFCGAGTIQISIRGLRYGALLEAFDAVTNKKGFA